MYPSFTCLLEAMGHFDLALQFAGDEVRNDREFMLEAMRQAAMYDARPRNTAQEESWDLSVRTRLGPFTRIPVIPGRIMKMGPAVLTRLGPRLWPFDVRDSKALAIRTRPEAHVAPTSRTMSTVI